MIGKASPKTIGILVSEVVRVTSEVAEIVKASYSTITTVDQVASGVHGAPSKIVTAIMGMWRRSLSPP